MTDSSRTALPSVEPDPDHSRHRVPAVCRALCVVALLIPAVANAQPVIETVFTSPPSPVGAGARATGIGSAFIAVADDATAASWNPGGLTQLERPEMSAVGRVTYQVDRLGSSSETSIQNDIEQTITVDGETDSSGTATLDYLSGAIPFTIEGRNIVASLNYQQMLSFDRDLHFSGTSSSVGAQAATTTRLDQSGGVDAATLALAAQVSAEFSIGAALNYWLDGLTHPFAWRQTYHQQSSILFGDLPPLEFGATAQITYRDFRGMNGAVGFLWDIDQTVSIGGVFKLPFTADVTRITSFPADPTAEPFRDHLRFEMPEAYGIGFRWRPHDRFMLAGDVTYVNWGEFHAISQDGRHFLVTGDPVEEATVLGVFTERIGAEYLWIFPGLRVAARGGLAYDPEPARGEPKPYFVASTGLGLSFADFSFDFAYQLRFGLDVAGTSVATQVLQSPSIEADQFHNAFYFSTIVYF